MYFKVQNSTLLCYVFLIAGIVLMYLGSTFFLVFNITNKPMMTILVTLKDSVFTIGFMLYLIPILTGRFYICGVWLKENFFVYMSKLTIVSMIVGPIVMDFIVKNFRSIMYFSTTYFSVWAATLIVSSYLVSMVICGMTEVTFNKILLSIGFRNKA